MYVSKLCNLKSDTSGSLCLLLGRGVQNLIFWVGTVLQNWCADSPLILHLYQVEEVDVLLTQAIFYIRQHLGS